MKISLRTPKPGATARTVLDLFRHLPRLRPFVRPHWRLAVVSSSLVCFSALLGLAGPWPLAIMIDTLLGRRHLPGAVRSVTAGLGTGEIIALVVVAGLLLNILGGALGVIDSYVNTKLSMRISYDFRSAVYGHAQRLSLAFHDRVPIGQLMFKVGGQTGAAGQIVVEIPPIVQAVLTAAAMLVVTLLLDWQLALLAFAMVPFVVYSTRHYARRVMPRLYSVRSLEMQAQSIMYEGFSMIRVITSFGRERDQVRRWRARAFSAQEARINLTLRQTIFGVVVDVITGIGTALVLGLGAAAVLDHRLNIGELVVLLGYVGSVYAPVQQLSSTFGALQQLLVNFEQALGVLDREPAVEDAPDAIELPPVAGAIAFRNVGFSYDQVGAGSEDRDLDGSADGASRSADPMAAVLAAPELQRVIERARALGLDPWERLGAGPPTLIDVSFEVPAGRHVAIVGPTGAGKTTILSLIMRFYDPTGGSILIDGLDLRTVKLASLRSRIGIVLQEPMLFAGTIGENILYGKPEASEADVIAAARAANIHDFISRLPDKYETAIGEGGSQISQGERQRISIARAFIKDAPVLLLDEPTSSIDAQTEAGILAALQRLMEGRTTFTVAHRLSTVRRADLILVLDHGRIIQSGTHTELCSREGLYRQLHDLQFGTDSFDDLAQDEQGETATESTPSSLLALTDLLAAALALLLEDGSVDPLVALFERLPWWTRVPATWLLIGAVLAALHEGSDVPLRRLARSSADPRLGMRWITRAAAGLLEHPDLFQSARGGNGRGAGQPLDYDLLLRSPWTEVEKLSPRGSKQLRKINPVEQSAPPSGTSLLLTGSQGSASVGS